MGHDDRATKPVSERSEQIYASNEADVRLDTTRERFGGIDVPATLIGALVALALTAMLGAIGGAVLGTTIFGDGPVQSADVIPSAIVGGLVLALAYFVGGWAAGRIARYNGVRNGVVTAMWTIVLAVLVGAATVFFGERYDVTSQIGVPNWVTSDYAVSGGIVGALAAVALMVLFAVLGGRRGETYHRTADDYLARPHFRGT